MKRPTWVTAIGIICIVLGTIRLFNAVQLTLLPEILEKSKSILEHSANDSSLVIEDTIAGISYSYRIKQDSADQETVRQLNKILGNTLKPSGYILKWSVRMGYSGSVVMLIYILGGILLLFGRPFSFRFLYFSLGLAVVYYVIFIMIMLSDKSHSYLSFGEGIEKFVAVIIDLTLLGYAIGGSKEYFYRHKA